MYTKVLAQGTKFGSGTTGLDNPTVVYSTCKTQNVYDLVNPQDPRTTSESERRRTRSSTCRRSRASESSPRTCSRSTATTPRTTRTSRGAPRSRCAPRCSTGSSVLSACDSTRKLKLKTPCLKQSGERRVLCGRIRI